MNRIVLSSLGTGDYEETEYVWNDQICKSRYIQEAVVSTLPDVNRMLLIVTPESISKHWNDNGLKGIMDAKNVDVELLVFESMEEHHMAESLLKRLGLLLQEGDEVILEITHSFRTLPMFLLGAIHYFMRVKGVKLGGILYGNHVARVGSHSPIGTLNDTQRLLEWGAHLDLYQSTGSYSPIYKEISRTLEKKTAHTLGQDMRIHRLQQLNSMLLEFHEALFLGDARLLVGGLDSVRNQIADYRMDLDKDVIGFQWFLDYLLERLLRLSNEKELRVQGYLEWYKEIDRPWEAKVFLEECKRLQYVEKEIEKDDAHTAVFEQKENAFSKRKPNDAKQPLSGRRFSLDGNPTKEKPERTMFLVFSHTLTEEQMEDARNTLGVTEFVYLSEALQSVWSQVPADRPDVARWIHVIVAFLNDNVTENDILLVQGDFGATHYLVQRFKYQVWKTVYSTTVREAVEKIIENRTEVLHVFRHVRFREYE